MWNIDGDGGGIYGKFWMEKKGILFLERNEFWDCLGVW